MVLPFAVDLVVVLDDGCISLDVLLQNANIDLLVFDLAKQLQELKEFEHRAKDELQVLVVKSAFVAHRGNANDEELGVDQRPPGLMDGLNVEGLHRHLGIHLWLLVGVLERISGVGVVLGQDGHLEVFAPNLHLLVDQVERQVLVIILTVHILSHFEDYLRSVATHQQVFFQDAGSLQVCKFLVNVELVDRSVNEDVEQGFVVVRSIFCLETRPELILDIT